MKLKNIHIFAAAVVLAIAFLLMLVLMQQNNSSEPPLPTPTPAPSPNQTENPNQAAGVKVEVIHFHGTNQCYSCVTVGDYAAETVNTYFPRELAEGKLSFAHVNAELPENRALVEQYGVTSASLWIGVYDATGFHKEENTRVWYKISDKADYMSYLKGIIEKRLNGDFSG